MLQYLSRDARSDIKLAINQVIHHTHNPKVSYDIVINFTFRYLNVTID